MCRASLYLLDLHQIKAAHEYPLERAHHGNELPQVNEYRGEYQAGQEIYRHERVYHGSAAYQRGDQQQKCQAYELIQYKPSQLGKYIALCKTGNENDA